MLSATDFGPIFDQHYDRIWAFLYHRGGRDCADELAGEVFATALAKRDRYDPSRGEVSAWLHGIAANQARAWLRRRRRGQRAATRLASISTVEAQLGANEALDRVDARLSSANDARIVLAALRRLPDDDQEVLVLFVWQGLTYEEIASALGVAVGTVRSRLSRSRARLRELSAAGGQVPGETPIEEPR